MPSLQAVCAASSGRPGTPGDALDEEVEDRLGGHRRFALRDTPARKVPIDVHAGKAIDQSTAGELDPFQVGRVQLPAGEGFGERGFGQADQLGIVPGQFSKWAGLGVAQRR